jgi:hypothetical protein
MGVFKNFEVKALSSVKIRDKAELQKPPSVEEIFVLDPKSSETKTQGVLERVTIAPFSSKNLNQEQSKEEKKVEKTKSLTINKILNLETDYIEPGESTHPKKYNYPKPESKKLLVKDGPHGAECEQQKRVIHAIKIKHIPYKSSGGGGVAKINEILNTDTEDWSIEKIRDQLKLKPEDMSQRGSKKKSSSSKIADILNLNDGEEDSSESKAKKAKASGRLTARGFLGSLLAKTENKDSEENDYGFGFESEKNAKSSSPLADNGNELDFLLINRASSNSTSKKRLQEFYAEKTLIQVKYLFC